MKPILVSLLPFLCFISCSSLKIKSLDSQFTSSRDCYKSENDFSFDNTPEYEIQLIRQSALRSKALFLYSEFGMIEKTARVFIINQNKIYLTIHFFGKLEQIIKDYPFEVQVDNQTIGLGRLKLENRNIIGEVFEEELSIELSKNVFEIISNCDKLKLLINQIPFEIPFQCREEWRILCKKVN